MEPDKKKKILIIEDDNFLAGMYVTKLSMENFEVKLAENGEDGLKLAKNELPDLILLDILLPRMDGFEVLKTVKDDPEMRNIPVIMLTNVGQKVDVDRGLALGAKDYLIKAHFMPNEVVAKIKKSLKS